MILTSASEDILHSSPGMRLLWREIVVVTGCSLMCGPSIANPAEKDDTVLGYIAVTVANKVLRPVLTKWRPPTEGLRRHAP